MRFSDGFDTSAIPRPPPAAGRLHPLAYTPGGTSTVEVKELGYGPDWYARIVADAGDKYHVPDHMIDPRISSDRLLYL